MTAERFIEPLDVLFSRTNHLFGAAAGDASRALMPPWPSVFAGALRSRMLADAGASVASLDAGTLPAPLDRILGTPDAPGDFTLTDLTVARQAGNELDVLRPVPADVVVHAGRDGATVHRLRPRVLPPGVMTSAGGSRQLAILPAAERAKPVRGQWFNAAGWHAYLAGQPLSARVHLVDESALWRNETRLGIALDGARGAAAEGQLYTSDAVSLASGVGFLARVAGADAALPAEGLLRLGGDGRGARISVPEPVEPCAPDWQAIESSGRFRLTTTAPALFTGGERPPGVTPDGLWSFGAAQARLTAAAVPRHQVVSGWDMHRGQPKPAERCVPAGAVYWFDCFEGDIAVLRKFTETGLWDDDAHTDWAARRAEGFNRVAIAND